MTPIHQHQLGGRNPSDVDASAILEHLTTRQHVNPHATIRDAIDQAIERFGCCPAAIERGMEWLGIDPAQSIGRLRRSELVQLARAVHRFWSQNAAAVSTGG